jgi:acetaldehyde dehydrogenase/alcohol dehydrogenase
VATFVFKTLIAVKGRNAVILCPSRRAHEVSKRVGALLQQVLREQGAPIALVQWVPAGSDRRTTTALMRHPQVGLVLATGGAAMVRLPLGHADDRRRPRQRPVLISADADVGHAARAPWKQAFDSRLVCRGEQPGGRGQHSRALSRSWSGQARRC